MGNYIDKDTGKLEVQNGKAGAVHVILTDKDGVPQDPATDPVINVNVPAQTPATTVSRTESAAASTNAKLIKAGATTIISIDGFNAATDARFLRLYDKTTAPTVGTDTAKLMYALAPGQRFHIDVAQPAGFRFTAGLGVAITGLAAVNDATAVAAGDIVGLNIIYV